MKTLGILIVFFLTATVVNAQEYQPQYEISGGTSVGMSFNSYSGSQPFYTAGSLAGMVGYIFGQSGFELLANPNFSIYSYSGTSTQTSLSLLLMPEYNFSPEHFADSWFVYLGPGLNYSSTLSAVNFEFMVGAGRRVQLFQHVSWSPQVSYTGINTISYFSNVNLSLLNFSVNF
jgi:hypothetical protein